MDIVRADSLSPRCLRVVNLKVTYWPAMKEKPRGLFRFNWRILPCRFKELTVQDQPIRAFGRVGLVEFITKTLSFWSHFVLPANSIR